MSHWRHASVSAGEGGVRIYQESCWKIRGGGQQPKYGHMENGNRTHDECVLHRRETSPPHDNIVWSDSSSDRKSQILEFLWVETPRRTKRRGSYSATARTQWPIQRDYE